MERRKYQLPSRRFQHKRGLRALSWICLFLVACTVYYSATRPSGNTLRADRGQENVGIDVAELGRFNITPYFHYARCEIFVQQSTGTAFTKSLDADLPEFSPADIVSGLLQSPGRKQVGRECSVTVPIPQLSARPSLEHVLFGLASTAERVSESLEAMAHWAAGTGVRVIALLAEDENLSKRETLVQFAALKERAATFGIDLKPIASNLSYDERWMSLVQVLYKERTEGTQWFAFIDDDTFFPSARSISKMLDKYDPAVPHYIGGLSEDLHQIMQWTFMAFGGAGVFLSRELIRQLQGDVYKQCLKHAGKNGDTQLALCIYRFTTAKLDWEHGLHQMDLRGDQSGFYESGREPPLSVHHWKSWFNHDMAMVGPVASVCGDECLFRRWKFRNGWFLNNGFSMVKYSHETSEDDIRMERTWYDHAGADASSYNHAVAPLKPKDEGKFSLRLEGSIAQADGVKQVYIHRARDDADRVVEIFWRHVRPH